MDRDSSAVNRTSWAREAAFGVKWSAVGRNRESQYGEIRWSDRGRRPIIIKASAEVIVCPNQL